jgi:tetratricopeptide (TPR) repeat protein
MVPTRRSLIFHPLRQLGSLPGRCPKTSIVLGLLFCLLAGWGGVKVWAAYHLRAAERAWQEDRVDDARGHLQFSERFYPLETHLLGARMERLLANYAEAEQHLRECKNIQGVTDRIQLEWVLLRTLQGELTGLESELWETIKKKDPNSSLILETLALSYMRDFRYQAAAYCLNKLLEREPENLRALEWRSWVWEKLDNKEGLVEDCNRALTLCPHLWKVRLRLAWVMLMENNLPAATEHVGILQQANPDFPEVRLLLARWQMLKGQTTQSRQTLDALLLDHPDYPTALLYRGKMEEDPIQQEKYFRRALKEDPFLSEAMWHLARSLEKQQRGQEAQQFLARHKKVEKDFQRLKSTFDKLEKSPSVAHLAQIGEIYLELGIPENARRFFGKVLELDPTNVKAHQAIQSLDKQLSSSKSKR